ncbi:MAG: PrgI family protein [Candidatus Yanofskybacteria bacterium]|nr:PrgI family protein [Candidatus Yanofskybacteria bacterium]
MRYQLPQFIETEVKLVGPFTLRQFLWVAAGSALIFIIFSIGGLLWFFILGLPIAAIFLSLAFVKINELPLINYIAYALSYIINPHKYVYKNDQQGNIQLPETK